MEPGGVAHGNQKAVGTDKPCRDLSPEFRPGTVDEPVPPALKFLCRSFDVTDLEFDARLGNLLIRRPLLRTETGLGSFGEGPEAEVLDSPSRSVKS